MLIEDQWIKSARSSANGQCLEAKWTKATASSGSGQCLEAQWRKADASGANGDCVEAKVNDAGLVAVRDSKDPEGPVLLFTPAEWEAFLDGAKKGEFDLPAEATIAAEVFDLLAGMADRVRRERPAEVA